MGFRSTTSGGKKESLRSYTPLRSVYIPKVYKNGRGRKIQVRCTFINDEVIYNIYNVYACMIDINAERSGAIGAKRLFINKEASLPLLPAQLLRSFSI